MLNHSFPYLVVFFLSCFHFSNSRFPSIITVKMKVARIQLRWIRFRFRNGIRVNRINRESQNVVTCTNNKITRDHNDCNCLASERSKKLSDVIVHVGPTRRSLRKLVTPLASSMSPPRLFIQLYSLS